MTARGVGFPLFTSRYAEKRLAGARLAAVGITVGHPRFRLGYQLSGKIRMLAPERAWFSLAEDDFEARYIAKLDATGSDAVKRELTVVFESRPNPSDEGMALLCFEDVTVPGSFCHRRLLAAWFERETGQFVPELTFGEDGV